MSEPEEPGSGRTVFGASAGEALRTIEGWPGEIVGYAVDYPSGHDTGIHSHDRRQLVHGTAGVLDLRAERGAWVVPAGLAVWVPAGIRHRVRAPHGAAMRTLYVAESLNRIIPGDCTVVRVSPLLRELIVAVTELPRTYADEGPESRLIAVLVDTLEAAEEAPLALRLPEDRRAIAVADALIADPADDRSLDDWGRAVGASGRTLARLFQTETGLTFAEWRRRRLHAALERLAAGQAVTTVALDLGYRSPSAFVSMFKRNLGVTPGQVASAAA